MIKIITVGFIKEKYLQEAIKEYKKRISKYTNLEIIEIKDEGLVEKTKAISLEASKIEKYLNEKDYVITLEIEGEEYSSPEFAEKIRSESARMLVLIGDIIRLSELDASPEKPHEDLVDLVSVAEECKERLAQQAEQRGIRITITGQSEPIVGSLSEITVLVYNLIDNAIKYNRENGNIDVEISDKTVVVSDTGIGIPKDSIPRIFERFYRTDKSRSRAKGGTGLGLSIVKHIADRHNARIDVESMLNVGTNITVKF